AERTNVRVGVLKAITGSRLAQLARAADRGRVRLLVTRSHSHGVGQTRRCVPWHAALLRPGGQPARRQLQNAVAAARALPPGGPRQLGHIGGGHARRVACPWWRLHEIGARWLARRGGGSARCRGGACRQWTRDAGPCSGHATTRRDARRGKWTRWHLR